MMFIEEYSAKSFVVRGETTPHKDKLKDMGGKWNSRLTEKNFIDKFGAWLFWTDKREEVEKWLTSQPVPPGITVRPRPTVPKPSAGGIGDVETMLRDLVIALGPEVQNKLTKTPLYHRLFAVEVMEEDDDVDDVDDDAPRPRRLLG